MRAMTFQAAPVAKSLGSVKRICQAGHYVIFDEDGSCIVSKITGELNWLREQSGNYMLDNGSHRPCKLIQVFGEVLILLLAGSHDPGDES